MEFDPGYGTKTEKCFDSIFWETDPGSIYITKEIVAGSSLPGTWHRGWIFYFIFYVSTCIKITERNLSNIKNIQ